MANEGSTVNSGPIKKRRRSEGDSKTAVPASPPSLLLLVKAVDTMSKDSLRSVSPLSKPMFPTLIPSSPVAVIDMGFNEACINDADEKPAKRQRLAFKTRHLPFCLNHVHYNKLTTPDKSSDNAAAGASKETNPQVAILNIGRPLCAPPHLLSGMQPGEIRGC